MKVKTTNTLLCPVFGHNLKYTSKEAKKAHIISCANCQSQQDNTDFETIELFPFKNREIRTTLQELFILHSQYSRRHISA